jgi:deoxyribonuclease V
MWPADPQSLVARQEELAGAAPEPWRPAPGELRFAGCWVCFPRGQMGRGSAGDPAWTAAVMMRQGELVEQHVSTGVTGAPYVPGLLSLRVGPLLEGAVRKLPTRPDVLLLDASGRDHPRGAGLGLHLGAVLDIPTVGITHRPLVAEGDWPDDRRGAVSPLVVGATVVGCWMRTRQGARPIAVHPGWRMDLPTAVKIVTACTEHRLPDPLRRARSLARRARDGSAPRDGEERDIEVTES